MSLLCFAFCNAVMGYIYIYIWGTQITTDHRKYSQAAFFHTRRCQIFAPNINIRVFMLIQTGNWGLAALLGLVAKSIAT